MAGNDLSQPIVHSSEGLGVDVSPNAVQYSDSPVQGHTTGRSLTFESTGHGFESYNNGVPQSPDIVTVKCRSLAKPSQRLFGSAVAAASVRFSLDFNRVCPLSHEAGNHSSANEFPADVDAYIDEECKYGAILGPFQVNPIVNVHNSPFMTRNKPNSDRRRVIIDLSWPLGASVNSGIDKNTYLDTLFSLTFPTVDDIIAELKRIGRGALLYKIDVSRAFRHVKVDPGDYDLLGLHWRCAYIDTCLPFGKRHGSQIFQCLSDAVRYMMRQKGFHIIDYIDDYELVYSSFGDGQHFVGHKAFQTQWSGHKVLIRCDNEGVVTVLRSGKTRDPNLGACAKTYGMWQP